MHPGSVSASILLLTASWTVPGHALDRDPQPDQPVRYLGPVDAADEMGGYRSDAILVRLAPGFRLESLRGSLAVIGGDKAARPNLDRILAAFGASESSPVFAFTPVDPARFAGHGLDRWRRIELPAGSDSRSLVAVLRAAGSAAGFDRVELEGIGGILDRMPNDPSFPSLYGMHNTGQVIQGVAGVADADLDLPSAWAIHTGSADITIAIIDTGVSASHPDLVPKLVPGRNTVNDNANADDSWLISHGSHCAGIAAAASDNGIGVTGVSWGARIMPVKVLTTIGSGTEGDVAEGIVWAADNGAEVLSMSLGFPGLSTIVEDAVEYASAAGKVIVAASGNTAGAPIGAPAVYPAVIAVGATDNRDLVAEFTTTGPELDVSAPGVNVFSTWDVFFQPNTYTWQSGTSMACPHVAGLAALVWGANPELSAVEVRAILESTADDRGTPGWDPTYGHGRVNALAAVIAATTPPCGPADLDCDGEIGPADLALLLADWGGSGEGDIDGDGEVGPADLALLLAGWG
jgi:subtilisin family serine protease